MLIGLIIGMFWLESRGRPGGGLPYLDLFLWLDVSNSLRVGNHLGDRVLVPFFVSLLRLAYDENDDEVHGQHSRDTEAQI